jgi:hypothetical protein
VVTCTVRQQLNAQRRNVQLRLVHNEVFQTLDI